MFTIADKKTTTPASHRQESRETVFFRKAGQEIPTGQQQHSFFSPHVQAKLSVSHPDDPQEKEADAVAEHVMRMPEPVATTIQNKGEEKSDRKEETEEREKKEETIIRPKTEYPTVSLQRKESEEDDKVQMKFFSGTLHRFESGNANIPVSLAENEEITQVNRKPNTLFRSDMIRSGGRGPPEGSTRFETILNSSKGQGSPMPESTNQFMGSRFNADFSGVRIHTGSDAESMSRQMNAQAFTHGNDIYFNSGKYSPHTDSGGMLLAHELTHTIQQGANVSSTSSQQLSEKKFQAKEAAKKDEEDKLQPSYEPPQVQLKAADQIVQRSWLGNAWNAVTGLDAEIGNLIEEGINAAKGLLMDKLVAFVEVIPGYKLARYILGHDPVSGKSVDKTPLNLLIAVIELVPVGGSFILSVLDYFKATQPVADWLFAAVGKFVALLQSTGAQFEALWNGISLESIKDPEKIINQVAELFRNTITSIFNFAVECGTTFLKMVKDIALTNVVDFVQNYFPDAFDMLCIVLGENPITKQKVVRNGTNIMNAGLKMLGEEGAQMKEQMMANGIFQKCVAWIARAIMVVTTSVAEVKQAFSSLWNTITFESLFHPVDTFNLVVDKFKRPVTRVFNFIKDAAIALLKILRDALLGRLSAYAKETKGYFLLTVLIQKDPFTGEHVDFNVENLIHGFMKLMEGGEEQFQQMKESGAIARASQKITAAVKILNFTWEYIKGLFTSLWESLGWKEFLDIIGVFARIVKTFGKPVLRLIAFLIEIIRIVIEVLLIIMNFPFELINNIIAKAMLAFEMIKKDPIGFLKNLLRAIKQGFTQFFGNILTHLWNGLKAWFLGEVKAAGIPIPADFSVMGIIKWLLAVLDITMEKIWKKLEERLGKEKVAKIRNLIDKAEKIANAAGEAYEFVQDVQKRGFMAVMIDKIKEKLSNVWDMVLEAVKSFVMDQIIRKITTKLLSMLDPSGIMAVVNSAIALYKAIQSFIRYLRQMLEIVNSFVEGLVEIASGATKSAANFLEGALARGVPIVIGFFANQVGLNLSERLKDALELVREKVDKGLTWVIDKLVTVVEKLVTLGKAAVKAVTDWWRTKKPVTTKDGQAHTLYLEGSGDSYKLMIKSTPDTFKGFIQSTLKDNGIIAPVAGSPEEKALNKADEIDLELSGYSKVKQENRTAWGEKIVGLIDELALLISQLKIKLDVPDPHPPSVVRYGAPNAEGFATIMDAELLSVNNVKGELAKEEQEAVLGWDYARSFQAISAKGKPTPLYVKGHLLNDRLGGLANVTNLTPITQTMNKAHLNQVEVHVKKLVLGQSSDRDKISPMKVANYTVDVEYNKHPKRGTLITFYTDQMWQSRRDHSVESDKPAPDPKKLAEYKAKDESAMNILALLLYEENSLTTGFNCKWEQLEYNKTSAKWEPVTGTAKTVTVPHSLPAVVEHYKPVFDTYKTDIK